jgi:hypothetical protein
MAIWSAVEPLVGIIGACSLLMTPVFRKVREMFTKMLSHESSESGAPHTHMEEGRIKASRKTRPKDDIPLTTSDELNNGGSQNYPKDAAHRVSEMQTRSNSSITRDTDFQVKETE